MELLEMRHITKSFPGVRANSDVDFVVKNGEIHALLGENGAGKTTLMNILFGLYQADSGQIFWKSEERRFTSPIEALQAGIGMVHQHFMLVSTMTALQNIILGLRSPGYPFKAEGQIRKELIELAAHYGLQIDFDRKISELSVGEQQRVEIIKALYRKAELLILDEPTAVLTPSETGEFFAVLRRLKREGHAIILITHRMTEIMEVSDSVTVLRDGRNVVSASTGSMSPSELSRYMIGRELHQPAEKLQRNEAGQRILALEQVCLDKGGVRRLDVNFSMQEGEILGIAGIDGNGQKELAEVVAGIVEPSTGTIVYREKNITRESVRNRYEAGISYISDDRHHDGLVMDMNVAQNLLLRSYRHSPFARHGVLQGKEIRRYAQESTKLYQVKTPTPETKIRLLSGGNQQKVILAREINDKSQVIVAMQPTRGLDIGATEQIRSILVEQRNLGKSVLLISADLDEILELSDRIAVMFRGRIMGILKNDGSIEPEKIGQLMVGHLPKEEVGIHAKA